MRSINPFLQSGRDQRIESLNRVVSVLLQGMALHSFCYDESEFARFQGSLRKLRQEIAHVSDEDTALILAGSAIRTLEEYSGAAAAAIAKRHNLMEEAMALVADSLITVGHANDTLAMELKESERDVAAANTPAEARQGRERLAKCLEEIRLRALRRAEVMPLSSQSYSGDEIDVLTGLPDSRKAVDALVAVWDRREDYQAAVFAVRRLDMINARYGFAAGDEVLRVTSEQVSSLFSKGDSLFRWRGPYLFGLINRRQAESRILPGLQRLAAARQQHTLMLKDREVILSTSMAWTMAPLEAESIEEMIRSLDNLTTIQLRQAA